MNESKTRVRTALAGLFALSAAACSLSHEVVRLGSLQGDAGQDATADMDVDAGDDGGELPTWSAPLADDRVVTRLNWTTVYIAYRPANGAGATTYVSALTAGTRGLAAAGTTALTPEQHAFGSIVDLDSVGPGLSRGVHVAMVGRPGARADMRHVLVGNMPRTTDADAVMQNDPGPTYVVANMPPPLAVHVEQGTAYGVVMPSTAPRNSVVPFALPVSTTDPGSDVDSLSPQPTSRNENAAVDFAYLVDTAVSPLVVTRSTVIGTPEPVEYGFLATFPSPQLAAAFGPCGSPYAAIDVARSSMQVVSDTAVAVETCNTADGRVARGFVILREVFGESATLRMEPLVGLDTGRALLADLQVATTGSSFLVAAVYAEPLDATHRRVVAELVEYVYDPRSRSIRTDTEPLRVVLLASSSDDTETLVSFDLHASYELVVLETITSDAATEQNRVTLRSLLR